MGDLVETKKDFVSVPAPNYTSITEGYQAALEVVDDVILKKYISELSRMEIVPLSETVLRSNIRDNVLSFH